MTLKNWESNGWLKSHSTSKQEIEQLLQIVDRDIKDSKQTDLSPDWRFGIAYNAALKLCTILLYSEGFMSERNAAHYRTIQSISLILGKEREDDADYLNTCRAKRNMVEYDSVGGATDAEADELIDFVENLKDDVLKWLKINHPEFL
ncbi:MAG: hypothetical protein PF638_09430 [Candidatus Delongbacteria bacterium]|jgi:hypothetical protein|nr:hypothetical protein [Candidatus Delongbacteria bacterium]